MGGPEVGLLVAVRSLREAAGDPRSDSNMGNSEKTLQEAA